MEQDALQIFEHVGCLLRDLALANFAELLDVISDFFETVACYQLAHVLLVSVPVTDQDVGGLLLARMAEQLDNALVKVQVG